MMTDSHDDDACITLDREGELEFAKPMYRALVRDGRLSFAARGLFQFLWDLPANWRPRICHLVKMSGAGKDALQRRRQELEAVGGIKIVATRLTEEQATARNAANPRRRRPYRAGQVVGSRWVLVSPHLWARATPLDGEAEVPGGPGSGTGHREPENPTLGEAEGRQLRASVNPPLRFTNDQGSSNLKQQQADAPAAASYGKRIQAVLSPCGIDCWDEDEDRQAAEIEAEFDHEEIRAEVASIRQKPNRNHHPQSAFPKRVRVCLEARRDAAAKLAVEAEARRRAADEQAAAAAAWAAGGKEKGAARLQQMKAQLRSG